MFERTAPLVVRYRWMVLCLVGAATCLSLVWIPNIRYDFSPQALFEGGDDLVAFSDTFNAEFEHEDAVFLLVIEATGERDILHREALQWQMQLTDAIRKEQQIKRVDSVVSLEAPRYGLSALWNGQTLRAAPLIRNDPPTEDDENRLRHTLATTDLAKGLLTSEDLKVGSIAVFLKPHARDIRSLSAANQKLQQIIADSPPPPGYHVAVSGLPAIRVDIVENLKRDQQTLIPIVAVVFAVLLLGVFRRPAFAVLPLAAVGIGLGWTMGAFGLTGQAFNIVSNALPVLLLVIGVSNGVHVVSRYREEVAAAGGDRRLAAERTIEHTAAACMLATGTTAIGFLSLSVSNSDVLNAFGVQAAGGMALLYISAMLVLGAVLSMCQPPAARKIGPPSPVQALVSAAGYSTAKHPYIALLACMALVVGSLIAARNVQINTYLIETYDEDQPMLQTMRLVEDKLVGLIPLQISLTADHPQTFFQPDVYRKLIQVEEHARAQPSVTFVRSYVDLNEAVYEVTRGDSDLPPDTLAGEVELIKRIEWSRRLTPQVAETLNYSAFISQDGRRARILLRLKDVGTRETLMLIQGLEADLADAFGPGGNVDYRLTGDAYLSAMSLDRLIRNILASLLGATVIIFLVIGVLFRSVRVGLLAVLPNLTPLIATVGYMGLRGYDLNVSNVIVFSISLGIAVDDTIHFLARFREEISKTDDRNEAIRRTLQGAGRAIVLTSLLIVVGLSVLMFSEFVPTRRFAELISVTMLAALFGDLLLLPACLSMFWKK